MSGAPLTTIDALPPAWRNRAEDLRRFAPHVAAAFEEAAEQLEHALAEAGNETLSLNEAARESGLSSDHLGRLIREGKLPNAGRPGAPRLRRADVPRKPGRLRDGAFGTMLDTPGNIARAVVAKGIR